MSHYRLRLAAITAFAVASLLTGTASPARAQDNCPPRSEHAGVEAAFTDILNAARAQVGAGPLSVHPALTQAAALHSMDMVEKQYFDHTGLDGSSPGVRAVRAGYPSDYVAENIAINSTLSAQDVFDQWLNSEGHRRNMLNPEYNLMGLGVSCGMFEGFADYIYYTLMLGQGEVPMGHGGPMTEPTTESGTGGVVTPPDVTPPGEFVTTDGAELRFGNDALIVTFPPGWRTMDRGADAAQIDFQNEENTIYGLITYFAASELGVTPDMTMGALIMAQIDLVGGQVAFAPEAFVTLDGHVGAFMLVTGKFGYGYLFAISQMENDQIIYGEFYGLSEFILGNETISQIIATIRTGQSTPQATVTPRG